MLREHEYFCDCNKDEPLVIVKRARLGEVPETPLCLFCEKPMRKVWGQPVVNYGKFWKFGNVLRGKSKYASKE